MADMNRLGKVNWLIVLVIMAAIGLGLAWLAHDMEANADRLDQAEAETAANRAAVDRLVIQLERRGIKPAVDPDELPEGEEIQDIEIQDPEIQEPERQEPERNDPDPDDPERQDPESQDPESDDPESQDAEFDDPEEQEPEIQDPEVDDPEPDDPEPNDPDPDDPDPDDPDPNDEMDSFTFEWMGQTYRCTDPDNDRRWTCTPDES